MTFLRSLNNLSLRNKIAGLTNLLVIGTILVLTILSIAREQENFRKELMEQANLFLKTTTLSIRDSLYLLKMDELIDMARVLRDDPDVTSFVVYDSAGRVLVDSNAEQIASFAREPDLLGQKMIAVPRDTFYTEWQPGQLLAGQSIWLGNQVIGAVATGMSTRALDEKVRTITIQGALLALAALVIGGGLIVLLARDLTRPLQELALAADQMADGKLDVRVRPHSRDEIGRLGEAFNNMAVGLQEREWLRDLFGRFVSQEVAEALRTGQVRLEGENRVVSVLFCDIREFTDYSEHHTPTEVVAMLNEFLPLVVQAAQKHGGMVNKFGGDSTLIIYGAPHELEDSAYRAVLTALEIQTSLESLNQRLISKGDSPLRVGVGINTGIALAGAVGPRERQEYTVVGNTVNLAARIDGLNKQFPEHNVLISERTRAALGSHFDEFEMLSLGPVSIRGKNEQVEIWAVKGLKQTR
jgi:class 3 adenylate cyclase